METIGHEQVFTYEIPLGIFFPASFRPCGPDRKFMTRERRERRQAERIAGRVVVSGTRRAEQRNAAVSRLAYNTRYPALHVVPLVQREEWEAACTARRVGVMTMCKLAGLHRACQRRGVRSVAPLSDLPPFRSWA